MLRARAIPLCALAVVVVAGCSDDGILGIRGPAVADVPDSPSGAARIAFASTRGARWETPDIYVAGADGSDVTRLTFGTSPAWSPDGTRLAFRREGSGWDAGGIYIMNVDGSGERYLGPGDNPAWSSGGAVAFSLGVGASGGNIVVTDPNATSLRRLLPQGWALRVGEPCEGAWLPPHVDHPAWSADGRQIAFVLTCLSGSSRVVVTDADGTLAKPLVEFRGGWPAWSPDGRQIAFTGGSPDEERLFVLDLDTGAARELVPRSSGYYADFDVSWSRASGS